jgi:ParB-like chromosome segregation protein Spo0J
MTQIQNDDEPDSDLPTFAAAKQEQKALIAQLREGDAGDRRVAKALTQCREGNRCNLIACPVCERRKALPRWGVPAALVKSINGMKASREIYIKGIEIVGKRRPLNEEKVRALAASMDLLGQLMPITVRRQKKKVFLVCGLQRIEAAKRLGWDGIVCVELCGDKTDARLCQLMENLYRAELMVLERAEHIDELRTLVQTKIKGGQFTPPGGRQPKDAGIKKTAKVLGLTREEVRRAKAIAGISSKAKKAAKSAKLDNSQRALLEIAKQLTPKAQLRAVKEIVERKRAERALRASAAKQKATAEIAALKAGLAKDKRTRESLGAKIADNRQRLRELKDAPAADYGDIAITVTSPLTAPSQDQDESATDPPLDVELLMERHAAEVEDFQNRIRQLEEELSTTRQTAPSPLVDAASPATDVGDLPIPPFLERRALSEAEQRQADDLERVWANTWPLVRQRFLAKYAGGSAGTTQAPTSSNIH